MCFCVLLFVEQFDYHKSTSSSKQGARRNKKFKINHNINFDTCCPIQNDIVIARDLQQINAVIQRFNVVLIALLN
jgi:hypothetical protein